MHSVHSISLIITLLWLVLTINFTTSVLVRHKSAAAKEGRNAFLASLPLTCGTTQPPVSHVGSKVSVACPCIGLQVDVTGSRHCLCCGKVLIDKNAQMAAMMRDMMESMRCTHATLATSLELINCPYKGYYVQ